ncbi:MAG TPA: hypothetical protein VGO00_10050, partial [Kofleriaceae bacterium]|nr:hypothetical protein [Kofleriaceae bacterium]
LASASDDRRVWLWDVAAGTGAVRGEHMAGGIRVVAFAGDSIVTTGWDHEIRVWKPGQTTPESWSDSHIVHGAAIAPGGRVVVTGGEMEAIHAWDLGTHKLITALDAPGGQTSAIAFSRDGHWLVTAGKTPPIAWDATALTRIVGFGHHGSVGSLSYNTDGSRLVSGANDHTIRVWNAATGAQLQRESTGAAGCADGALALGADEMFTACDDNTLRRWDAAGHERDLKTDVWLRLGAVSPDGTTLAVGHTQGRLALVDLARWAVTTERTLHTHQIYGVQYSPSGRLVTSGLDDYVRTWRGPGLDLDLELRVGADNGALDAALSPDGSQVAVATEVGIDVWDTHVSKWIAHPKMGAVWKLQFTRDGARAVSASDDGAVRIWDPTTWRDPVVIEAGEGPALGLAISPDGRTVAAGYQSGAIAIWDLATHRLLRRIGGRTRDRGACSELDTETWADATHRSIIAAACIADPDRYLKQLAAHTHQRLDGEVDVTWDWLARAQR